MGVFWISRHWGRAFLTGPMGRYLPAHRLGSLEGWFARWGGPAIAVSRFFPGVRALVMPAAGLAAFAAWKVCVFAGVSVVAWNVFVVGIGLLAGTHLDWGKQVLLRYNAVAGGVVAAALVAAAVTLLIRRALRRAGPG